MRLIFATNNEHKIKEIKDILGCKYNKYIFTMSDLGVCVNPEENGKSFEENAFIKANALYLELKNKNIILKDDFIISDDSGMCIDYLNGEPGIMSARFLGSISQDEKNSKILEIMKDVDDYNRGAYFITVLSVLEINEIEEEPIKHSFKGFVNGYIVKNIEKTGGFGYDPIFAVLNVNDSANLSVKTYASIGSAEKNKISHRAKALSKFVEYLEKNHNI